MPFGLAGAGGMLVMARITVIAAAAVAVDIHGDGDFVDPASNPEMYGNMKAGMHKLDANGKIVEIDPSEANAPLKEGEAPPRQVFVPAWTEDELSTYNTNIPEHYACDACKGIAFSFTNAFVTGEKHFNQKELPESEFFDTIEQVCTKELQGKYGVKARHGNAMDKVFSGPGLAAHDLEDGQFGGDHWDKRMAKMCEELVDEFSEERIYELHRSTSKDLRKDLCKKKCAKKPKKKPIKIPGAPSHPKNTKGPANPATIKDVDMKNTKVNAELKKLRAENMKLKAKLKSCNEKRETAEASLAEMIEILEK